MAMNLPSSRSRSRRAPMADINVTPMVDVMLVLLIIFMVTAPLLNAGVPVNLPDSRAKGLEQKEQEPIQISLDGNGLAYVGDEQVPFDQLPARLSTIRAQAGSEEPHVYLRADKALQYGLVMRVMGELNRASLNKVSLVTTQSGDSE